jgi:hypothetical protein
MISFLFWNLNENAGAVPYVGRLAMTYGVDIFLFAECPKDTAPLITVLNAAFRGVYRVADEVIPEKVRVITRLVPSRLKQRLTLVGKDATIWTLQGDTLPRVLLVAAHLPSKAGGFTPHDQQTVAEQVARGIMSVEDQDECQDTILVGDMNMNPYEPGMAIVTGFHGLMTADLVKLGDRRFKGIDYRRFYNPMWGLYGDRTPGPAGTFYWDAYSPSNHRWHMLDQLLLRPSLVDRLRNVQILAGDGYSPFLGEDGAPDRDKVSDHLSILFQLEI